MSAGKFTIDQQTAIEARGDTLVVAGAGAGKTGTLVEKCLRLLLGAERISISRILVVTFTEAAAAEVRDRIRRSLEAEAAKSPSDGWIQEQMAGLDTALICTLHSFCLSLLRENFFALDLDPAVSVLPAEQAEMLFHEVFDQLLNEHFASKHEFSGALQDVIAVYFGGWEKRLRDFVRKLHHYTQTRPGPEQWFTKQIADLSADGAEAWRLLYRAAVEDWCRWWIPYLESLPTENENARSCALLMSDALRSRDPGVVKAVLARKDCWPRNKKERYRKPIARIFDEAEFLDSLQENGALEDDWKWNAGPLLVVLKFARQFGERYQAAKRGRGALDFHDLEQGAMKLLWRNAEPSPVALRLRERLEAVFVDEYQDINAAQDIIIQAVSRGGGKSIGNRFLVGDIKQSIYAFRQADPSIFGNYLKAAAEGTQWKPVFLSDNFRSHEGILKFINPLFRWLMRPDVGGIDYDDKAQLKFGARDNRKEMSCQKGERLPVELNVVIKKGGSKGEDDSDESGNDEDMEATEIEARIVAERLRELKHGGQTIYHQKEGKTRPVEWRDMVVLLRAASAKVEVYAKAFAAMDVPLETKRDGFFTAQEVLDLCNLLTILDNPIQDIPLVAVLRSPLVGLSANELASIRASAGEDARSFWAALNLYLKKQNQASAKVERFLERYHRWRNPQECFSLAQRLERVLAETGYAEWLLSQPRGRQRYANVQQLLRVARQFDEARGESLYLFLRHIQELQETAGDIEPATVSQANAVRLMTVHQSKGLEFPVVAVADLGKRFNTSDQNSPIVLDEEHGICAMIKAPETGATYPSLPLWLAQRQLRLAGIGEEMRVLYVALTRAENILLLFGSATGKQPAKWAEGAGTGTLHPQQLLKTQSWLDWIGVHAARSWPGCFDGEEDLEVPFTVRMHYSAPESGETSAAAAPKLSEVERQALLRRLHFDYPYADSVKEPAKTSVSALRNRMERLDEETAAPPRKLLNLFSAFDGRNRGLASHSFLQHVDLRGEFGPVALQRQAEDLVRRGLLEQEATRLIDWEAVADFWESETGREIRQRWNEVRRELPFTFRLGSTELARLGLKNVLPVPEGEFIVTQGVADLVVLGRGEIWLIDFKTDSVNEDDVKSKAEEYRPQIALYALALEKMFERPVTRRGLYFLSARKLAWLN